MCLSRPLNVLRMVVGTFVRVLNIPQGGELPPRTTTTPENEWGWFAIEPDYWVGPVSDVADPTPRDR